MVTPRMTPVPPEPPAWQPHPWMADALCRQVGSDIFYAEAPDNLRGKFLAAWTRNANAEAKSVCARCPVRDDCLDHAIATDERWGIWGGMTPTERRAEAARRGHRKPEKAPVSCGTLAGYFRHGNAKEAACEACQPVGAAYFRAKRARRRAA